MQGINPMDLCTHWDEYCLHNLINNPNLDNKTLMFLPLKPWYVQHKIERDYPNRHLSPLGRLLFTQLNQSSKTWQWNPDGPYFKTLRCTNKNRKGLIQWYFVTLGQTHIYTTESIIQTLTTRPWSTFFQKL